MLEVDDDRHHVVLFGIVAVIAVVILVYVTVKSLSIIEKQNKSRQLRQQRLQNTHSVSARVTQNTPSSDNLDPPGVYNINLKAASTPPPPYEEPPAYHTISVEKLQHSVLK